MRDALVFNGASNLDFQDIRSNVVRIPEVVSRIREAQSIWDTVSTVSLDLVNFICSEDAVFLGNIKLKSFATAVVQVGLLDRYLRSYNLPEFVLGAVNGDSPLRVAVGQLSFFDLVADSPMLTGGRARPITGIVGAPDLPVLAGVQLAEFGAFRREANREFVRLQMSTLELDKMIVGLVDDFEVGKVVMIGPGNTLFGQKSFLVSERDVQLLESIDLDPMLSWFWSRMRDNRLAIAN